MDEQQWDKIVEDHTFNGDPRHDLEVVRQRMIGCLYRGQYDRTEIARWVAGMGEILDLMDAQKTSDAALGGSYSESYRVEYQDNDDPAGWRTTQMGLGPIVETLRMPGVMWMKMKFITQSTGKRTTRKFRLP